MVVKYFRGWPNRRPSLLRLGRPGFHFKEKDMKKQKKTVIGDAKKFESNPGWSKLTGGAKKLGPGK